MKRIVIVGAGGHGQVIADILLLLAKKDGANIPIGFVDEDESLVGKQVLGLPILGNLHDLQSIAPEGVVVAIGDNRTRRALSLTLQEQGLTLVNAVHPNSVVAKDVRMGSGVMICPGAIVNTGTLVGDGVILNTGCTIDHHNAIDSYAHIAPGCNLGGSVTVGTGAIVGIGSAVLPGRSVGDWSVVAAGSVVSKDVPSHCVAAGSPARVIKRNAPAEVWPNANSNVQS